ncbi:MAG TPA: hypothetical protein VGR87_09865 [Candidatus Limnocylindria bacterium]|nr:hypothetical protein [Candidatus Limnocylindria bacterium]
MSAVYTLGQFFSVWDQPLSREQVLGERIGPGEEVRADSRYRPT